MQTEKSFEILSYKKINGKIFAEVQTVILEPVSFFSRVFLGRKPSVVTEDCVFCKVAHDCHLWTDLDTGYYAENELTRKLEAYPLVMEYNKTKEESDD
jgi:hypothetical protein